MQAAGNLPLERTPLLGRDAASERLLELMEGDRLVTLTGTGGIGKTSLALQVARRIAAHFVDGAWFVEFASLADPRLIPSAVALTLGLELGGHELSGDAVAAAIAEREILLLLDNCEHLVVPVAVFVDSVMRCCPGAKLLVTSREALQVEGERVMRVLPLEVPADEHADAGALMRSSAVSLFLDRMRAAGLAPQPVEHELAAIGAICRRLDGIPLAIEFAAARAATLGPETVLSLLDERFVLLTGGRRTALPHHRTLRAALDWSHDLLPLEEAKLLRRLSIFPAGFTADGARAVLGEARPELEVLQGIANLVSKSLVTVDEVGARGRWHLLETIRAYAMEKLVARGEQEAALAAQARHLVGLIGPALAGRTTREELHQLGHEIDNVRSALDWAFSEPGEVEVAVTLTAAFVPVWLQRLLLAECAERVDQALGRLTELSGTAAPLRSRLLTMLGFALLNTAGRVDRTRDVLRLALEAAEEVDDAEVRLRALWANWSLHFNAGDCHRARPVAARLLDVAQRCGDAEATRVGHRLVGSVHHFVGDQAAARRHLEDALAGAVPTPGGRDATWFLLDQRIVAKAMLARVLALQGRPGEAERLAQASLHDAFAADHRLSIGYALRNAVFPVALAAGDLDGAETSVRMLGELVERHGMAFWHGWTMCLEGQLLIRRGAAAQGVVMLREGVAGRIEAGWNMRTPEFLCSLGEGLAALGEPDHALTTLDEGLALSRRDGQLWFVPELHRRRALLLDAAPSEAERTLREALELAISQGAVLWQLRVAADLARMLARRGVTAEAVDLLKALISDSFGEQGLPELVAARHLLSCLTASSLAP
jgi:predicted ATPase